MSLLSLKGVAVHFGGVQALRGLDLEVEAGQIHGLIGPNGAGKTTAMNVISGLTTPTRGVVELEGDPVVLRPREAVNHGLVRTFQKPAMFDGLTAIDNVLVGAHAAGKAGLFRSMLCPPGTVREENSLRERAEHWLEEVGYEFSRSARVSELPFGGLRKIELARALMSDPRLLLLDELTSGLSEPEVAEISDLLLRLRDEASPSRTVLVVEHNVPFIFGLCDVVTAMDKGATIAYGSPSQIRKNPAVIESYLGKSATIDDSVGSAGSDSSEPPTLVISDTGPADVPAQRGGTSVPLLRVQAVTAGYGGTEVLHDVSLEVGEGELVAIFGRNGAGKSTLLNGIMGSPRARAGSVSWHDADINGWSTQRRVRAGLGLVPQGGAVLAEQTVDDNLLLATVGLRAPRREVRERYAEMMDRFPPLADRRRALGTSLSGGERQMLAIAKVLIRRPQLIMLDEPAAGLAPSIVDEVQELIVQLNREGLAVLVAEQNVSWVIPIAQRAYLLETGTVADEGDPRELAEGGVIERGYLGTGTDT